MKLKNEFANIEFRSKIEIRYESLLQTVKDEILNIYIPYFDKLAKSMFTDHSKNRIVCEIMEHHKDSIEQDDSVIVALHIMNMLNDILNKR